jgi:cell division protein FtsW
MERPSSGYHPLLTFSVLALLCIGMVMIYSASAFYAVEHCRTDAEFFLKRQALAVALGIAAMVIAKNVDYRWFRNRTLLYATLGSSLMFLGIVLLPMFHPVNGAQRWINLGLINFQPAEYAKIALIIYLAYSLARKQEQIKTFTVGFLPHVMLVGVFVVLLLKQPDFGTSVMLFLILFSMLFVAGAKISYLLLAFILAMPYAYYLVRKTPYRWERIKSFLHPFENVQSFGYQIRESLMSIGSGGLTGLGLGEGKQKLHFLPAAHTDFIFAIIGEELGFVGICVVILLFVALIYSGVRIAMRSKDLFGMMLASGITAWITFQTVINMMVVLGLAPTKGFPLPFISYGGTSIVFTLFSIGILHSINSRQGTPPPLHMEEDHPLPAGGVSARRGFAAAVRPIGAVRRAVSRGRKARAVKGRGR